MKSVIYIVDFISFQWSILFFIRVYYTMNLQKSFSKFLVNPLALKVVSAIAVINFLGYLILGNTNAVIYFLLLGLIVSYFSKNMILILGVPVILVNLFAAGKKTAEGFKGGKEGADTMKKEEDKDTDMKEEKPKVAEKFEVGRKKGKGSYDIDYASTVEDAYDELNKIIGSDGIQRLTKDTQGLMKQQMELTKAMKDMGPMVDKIEPMMGQLQSMMQGMKNMTGGKKEGYVGEKMTDVVGQRNLKQIER
jgi:hypothetical protein